VRLAPLLAIIAGCNAPRTTAQPTVAPVTLTHAHGVPGEGLEYRATLRGLGVGKVQVGVGRLGVVEGQRQLIVKTRGHSDGLLAVVTQLTWELTTTLDLDRARPVHTVEEVRVELVGDEKDHDRNERTWDDGDSRHDLHSAAAVIRGWRSKRGDRGELVVEIDSFGLAVSLWHATTELVYVTKRTLAAVRYDGIVADKYKFSVWLSDDLARVPLRLRTQSKWGEIVVELTHYEAPTESDER
jgi:hypothetical protein